MQVPLVDFVAGRVDISKEREKARLQIFRFKARELTTLAGIYWRRLIDEMQEAWKYRVRFLNFHDIPGELKCLPEIATEAVMIQSVNLEIDQPRRLF